MRLTLIGLAFMDLLAGDGEAVASILPASALLRFRSAAALDVIHTYQSIFKCGERIADCLVNSAHRRTGRWPSWRQNLTQLLDLATELESTCLRSPLHFTSRREPLVAIGTIWVPLEGISMVLDHLGERLSLGSARFAAIPAN